MTEIANLISNLGFPIACVVGLGVYIYSRDKAMREDNEKDKERLYEEIKNNREVNKVLLETNQMLVKDVKLDLERISGLLEKSNTKIDLKKSEV